MNTFRIKNESYNVLMIVTGGLVRKHETLKCVLIRGGRVPLI